MRNHLPKFLVRIFYYEYWPFWIFFLPIVPYYLFLALKHRSFTFFTLANQGIPYGGVFGESKAKILDKIGDEFQPKKVYCEQGLSKHEIQMRLSLQGISYPFIAKPDVGERGKSVEKINGDLALEHYLERNETDFIIQEFITYPIELGVLYYRTPLSGNSGITSIVQKEFLTVKGDGESNLLELIKGHDRARMYMPSLSKKWADELEIVPELEAILELQPIGNHCLGTKFLDATHLIEQDLVKVFDRISEGIDGFDYGRFDLRVKNYESLKKGEGISILELNGVTSEPGHIYDPKLNIFQAYRDTIRSLNKLSIVCKENKLAGYSATPPKELAKLIIGHFDKSNTGSKPEAVLS